ncbi:MAG: heat-inducible transcriptional repressor HrcA [Thermodesulfobacteriota bacterium]|nr:heat-inducible transcriptional repressor HrcA [Thermodesulfobacteriota bacterium]
MASTLNIRGKKILGAIVQEYIADGEPVGSRVLAYKYGLGLSPATIRNVMVELEETGCLHQPHVSAGRVPTIEGLRLYLDEILELKAMSNGEKSLITRHMGKGIGSLNDTLKESLYLLSEFSRNASIIILPKLAMFVLKHIEFVRLDAHKILVILVSKSGMIHNHIVYSEDVPPQGKLNKYNNYLNDLYADLTVKEMRDTLVKDMLGEKARFDNIVRQAISLSMRALDSVEDTTDLWIEGKESIFDYPEFADLDKLKEIVRAFEDKGKIVRILTKIIETPGVKVFLGEDLTNIGISDCGMVATGYCKGSVPVGSLGVIGPMRMDYAKVIPLVDYISRVLSNLLEEI